MLLFPNACSHMGHQPTSSTALGDSQHVSRLRVPPSHPTLLQRYRRREQTAWLRSGPRPLTSGRSTVLSRDDLGARQNTVRDLGMYSRTLLAVAILTPRQDTYLDRFVSTLCPQEVLSEAKVHTPDSVTRHWSLLPYETQLRLESGRALILDLFPRIPLIGATIVAEWSQAHNPSLDRGRMEKLVVDYAKVKWTSYTFRVLVSHEGKVETARLVAPRMRDVLEGWLEEWMERWRLAEFFKKYGLVEGERDQVRRSVTIMGYAGAEIAANVATRRWEGLPVGREGESWFT